MKGWVTELGGASSVVFKEGCNARVLNKAEQYSSLSEILCWSLEAISVQRLLAER